MWTPLERLFERGFSVHRSGFLVAGTLHFYLFSTLNLERRTQEPRTSTYRPTNSNLPAIPARHLAGGYGERKVANREPDNLSSYHAFT